MGGNKILVSIARRRDVLEADEARGASAEELGEPVYRFHAGKKIPEWKVDEGRIDIVSAAEYLRPLMGEYMSKLGL